MLFNSYEFIFLFLPATLAVFVNMRRAISCRAEMAWLVAASIIFYAWWNPIYIPLLAFLAAVTYGCARAIRVERQMGREARRRFLLIGGIACNLLALGYFKYTDFLLGTVNMLAGAAVPLQHIVLPLGISFFIFQKIGYLMDTSCGRVQEHNFLDYCFFVMFFPQLIAGPIVHHSEIFSQVRRPRAFTVRPPNVSVGFTIFVIGLFKKIALADNVADYANPVFAAANSGTPLYFFDAWAGALAYSAQLYFDFSGYSDMAIGIARLFGIRLPLNFNSPYKACNIIDFWRRWHMTLSRFLRDYLYFSLGGNHQGTFWRYINLFITMLLGGLWHGAGWTYVAWGALHGVYLIINHAWRQLRGILGRDSLRTTFLARFTARALTLIAVVVGWVIFRAGSISDASAILTTMAGWQGISLPQALGATLGHWLPSTWLTFNGMFAVEELYSSNVGPLFIVALMMGSVLLPNTQEILARYRPALGLSYRRVDHPRSAFWQWRPTITWGAAIALLFAASILSLQRNSEFLYFQF